MDNKQLKVIVLSGWSCAGKSIIAEILAKDISFDLIKIYDIYHSLALKKGYSRSREWLFEAGDEEFVKETVYEIVSKIKSLEYSKGIIIDASFAFLMNSVLNFKLPDARIINIAILSRFKFRLKRMEKRMNIDYCDEKGIKELIFRDNFLGDIHLARFLAEVNFNVWNEYDGDIEKIIEKIKKKLLKV